MMLLTRNFFLFLQKSAGRTLTLLLSLCLSREPCPNAKIVKNLSTFVCAHAASTPQIVANQNNFIVGQNEAGSGSNSPVIIATENGKYDTILTLISLIKVCFFAFMLFFWLFITY